MPFRPPHRIAALFAFAAALTACSNEIKTGIVLLPGESARAEVLGTKPQVIVETGGGEPVELVMHGGDGRTETMVLQGLVSHSWPGAVVLEVSNQGRRPAHVFVTARRADGLTFTKGEAPAR